MSLAGPFKLDVAEARFDPREWSRVDNDPYLWQHTSTGTIFQIAIDPTIDSTATRFSPALLMSYLQHVCEGKDIPEPQLAEELGQAAIVACIESVMPGSFTFTDEEDDGEIPF